MNVLIGIGVILIFAAFAGSLAFGSVSEGGGSGSAPAPQPLGGRMRLTASQIAAVARQAGFTGSALVTAIAVALAESSGKSDAYNPETAAGTPSGQGSFGLWQIYLKAHPEFVGYDLFDPQTNANAAYMVYQGAGYNFNPWSTFKNSAYTAHLDDATRYA